ncbi:MAG: carbon storage regulator [Oligoflexia bacterium]|nr:carbon storage regulator [Oligoflexia bacterium]
MTILTIHRKRVRLGIDAPPHAVFLRQTLYDRIKADLEEKAKEALGASQEAAAVQPEASKAPQSAPETPATSVGGWVAGIFGRRPKRD